MHPCLNVDEILRFIAHELVDSEGEAAAVSLACCCKCFEDPVLDTLWERQDRLIPLLKCFPRDVWDERYGGFSFKRTPTEVEWADFQKHARRMQHLTVGAHGGVSITSDVLLSLQLHAAEKPFLPRLKIFQCEKAIEKFIPFIPLFLSPKTIAVDIKFAEDSSITTTASLISKLSVLCPDLEYITLTGLFLDPVTIDAVSEMVLACNRNTLRIFQVGSPLTEEAREVVYQLPRLTNLCTTFDGPTSLPTVLLPDLAVLRVEYEDDFTWLQEFRGASLEKLGLVSVWSESDRIGDFLGAFESVALTTSVPNTLSTFRFHTTSSWDPNYRSLLSFRQLEDIEIEFSCDDGCSSKVDDNMMISLAQAMPKLRILRLGGTPCKTPGGVTADGLIGLACGCPHLSDLRVHFDAASLADATNTASTQSSSDEPVAQWGNCALTDLDVGEIPIPRGSESKVASTLLRIFPRMCSVMYMDLEWENVIEAIESSGRCGTPA